MGKPQARKQGAVLLERRERRPGASAQLRPHAYSRPVHLLVLALLLAILTAPTLLPKYSVVDNDIWLHLKVGDWIAEHHNVPHTGILSRTAGDRAWAAYSWLYELPLSLFHSWFHLVGISVYGLLLAFAVAYCIFWMTQRLSHSFWRASALAMVTCAACLYSVFPRPVFFSMALFTITLTLLLEARRSGDLQLLYWLPPIFVLWANVHIQFIYGIFLLCVFVGIDITQRLITRTNLRSDLFVRTNMSFKAPILLLGACLLATCINPYGYRLYSVVFTYATSKYPFKYVSEFQALSFRDYTDFVQLLLTGYAFFALGRGKKLDLFLVILLSITAIVGFRTQRDSWFVCIPAAACIALSFTGTARQTVGTIGEKFGLAGSVALLVFIYARLMNFNNEGLREAIAEMYPVRAINFLRDHPQPGPLYNNYDWGDFIAWYMPEFPVAIDGRTDLYGDETDTRSFLTVNADPSYFDDPYLNEAKFVLLPKKRPLAIALTVDPRFQLIYDDQQAVIFVRR